MSASKSRRKLTRAARKLARPKTSKLRPPGNMLRDTGRVWPRPNPEAVREIDGVEAVPALKEIHRKLEIAGAVAYLCAATLRTEAVNEQDVALCLRRLVGDEIDRQMEEIDRLLGREKTYECDEDDDGGAS